MYTRYVLMLCHICWVALAVFSFLDRRGVGGYPEMKWTFEVSVYVGTSRFNTSLGRLRVSNALHRKKPSSGSESNGAVWCDLQEPALAAWRQQHQ